MAFGELRVTDEEVGCELLKNLNLNENSIWLSSLGSDEVLANNFDRPLVALQIEARDDANRWQLLAPYGYKTEFSLKDLKVDDWDRFHGVTTAGVQFVMSRQAQAEFFRNLTDFDDEGIFWKGIRYEIPYLYEAREDIAAPSFWDEKYKNQDFPWDIDVPHPTIPELLKRMKLAKSRIAVLGSGRGHDAVPFADQGHIVNAMDLSEEATQTAKETYGERPNLHFETADAFKLSHERHGSYDIIFEHTLFCAMDPRYRKKLVKQWSQLLAPQGYLMGVFTIHSATSGPPFGSTQWEIRELLKKNFRFLIWERVQNSPGIWQGRELLVVAQKK